MAVTVEMASAAADAIKARREKDEVFEGRGGAEAGDADGGSECGGSFFDGGGDDVCNEDKGEVERWCRGRRGVSEAERNGDAGRSGAGV